MLCVAVVMGAEPRVKAVDWSTAIWLSGPELGKAGMRTMRSTPLALRPAPARLCLFRLREPYRTGKIRGVITGRFPSFTNVMR